MDYRTSCMTGSSYTGGVYVTRFSRIGDLYAGGTSRTPYTCTTTIAGTSMSAYPAVDSWAYSNGYATPLSASYTKQDAWECFQRNGNSYIEATGSASSSFCSASASCGAGCSPHGHKVVQSKKYWHGRKGFLCKTGSCYELGTKYLTVHKFSSYEQGETYTDGPDSGSTFYNYSGSVEKEWHVDRFTGVVELVSCSLTVLSSSLGFYDWDANFNDNVGFTMLAGDACIDAAYSASHNIDDGYGTVITLDYTDSSFTCVAANETEEQGQITFFKHTTICTLGDAYSLTDLYDDGVSLLSSVSLNDDINYPWRTDGQRGAGPLVARYEYPGAKCPDLSAGERSCSVYGGLPWLEQGYTSTSMGYVANCTYDGGVVGSLIASNVDRAFSWDHTNWLFAFGTFWTPTYYGAWTRGQDSLGDGVDLYMPVGATNWTENYDANYAPQGAFALMLGYGGDYSDGIWMQKFEEVKEPIQSYNYFRPCGKDRFEPDYTKMTCPTGTPTINSGSTINVSSDMTGLWAAGDYLYCLGYIVTVSSVGASSFTIANVISSDSTLFNEDINPTIIAKLRWYQPTTGLQDYTYRGICGRVSLTGVTGSVGQPITCSIATPHYFVNGDKVYFSASMGWGGQSGSYNIYRINEYSFAISGSVSAPSTSSVLTYLYPSSSLDYHWNDDAPKGDFVSITSQTVDPTYTGSTQTLWYGTVGNIGRFSMDVTQTQHCTSRYYGASPNNDLHSGSVSVNFPSTPAFAASNCGAGWQVYTLQYVTDPLWQQRYRCSSGTTYPESLCVPTVEPRVTPPVGASWPSGITNGLPTIVLQGAGAYFPATSPPPSAVAWNLCDPSEQPI